MGETEIGGLLHEAITVVVKMGGPPLLAGLVIGVVMSLFQAVTQIHEQTVTFVPKLIVVVGTLLLLGPYMTTTLIDFTRLLFDRVVAVGGL
jgi:flagellar biosynthetic protein FliQ